ncbi:MAG TPA: hypothetical protein VGX23_31750 [Actinocrinis sp.]|nr:hypothetical protein [Actinocrinis sp.]
MNKESTRRRATGPQDQPEQILFAYLSRVATESSGRLSPASRSRFITSLRDTIDQERSRHGSDLHTLRQILAGLGEPVMLVDAEVQRDPEYQARLSARLTESSGGPQVPLTDEVAEWLALPSPGTAGNFPDTAARHFGGSAVGPQVCLDPDPFAAEYGVETVGEQIESGGLEYGGELLTELSSHTYDEPTSPTADRFRTAWSTGVRIHPQEAIAIGLFLVGAVFAQWLILLAAGLIACTSKFWDEREKWTLVIGVPVFTLLVYVIGFWMHQHGLWGGHKASADELLSGAASFFGTLPRMTSILAAGYLVWRLARGITRQS